MAERDWRRDSGRDRDWSEDEERRWRGRGPQRSERYSESQYGRDRDDEQDRQRQYGGERQSGGEQQYGREQQYGSERQYRDDDRYQRGDRDQDWSSSGWGDDRNQRNQGSQQRNQGWQQRDQGFQQRDQGWQRRDQGGWQQRDQDRERSSSSMQTQPYGTTWSYYEFWLTPGPHSGRGPAGYRRNVERIKEDVCERLESHGDVDASQIQVEANEEGEITLTGYVKSRREKRIADDIAESVRGVKDVHNQLKVKSEKEESTSSTSSSGDQSRATGRSKG